VPHHAKWLDHKSVLRNVKLHMKIRHQTRCKGLVDRGKTVRVHGGLGAKFVMTGAACRTGSTGSASRPASTKLTRTQYSSASGCGPTRPVGTRPAPRPRRCPTF